MKLKHATKLVLLTFLLLLNVGCDQISKHIVRNKISEYEYITIIKDRFTLTKVENTGAFLSLGEQMPYIFRVIILSGLPVLFLGYGLYFLYSKRKLQTSVQIALCFLIGGGIGNLYDRILHGSVTDFMHLNFYFFETGIFNFADISIMIGIGILLIQSIQAKLNQPVKAEPELE